MLLLAVLFFNGAYAQKSYINLPDASKKTLKKFNKIQALSTSTDTASKKEKLEKLLEEEPVLTDALVELSRIEYLQGNLDKAGELLKEAINQSPDYEPDWYNIYAGICKAKEDYNCEKSNLQEYINRARSSRKLENAKLRLQKLEEIESILTDSEPVEIELLSNQINSLIHPEYKPVLSTNDSTIIFTRRVDGQEDFFQSELTADGWTEARPLIELNTQGNEGAHAISPNGKYMIFTRCDAPKRYRSCDLYISLKKEGKWTEPKYMGVANTQSWESQAAFSPDGKTVYFSSGRPGGQGNKDLYYIRNNGKSWGEVTNLGDIINTKGNEESPYIHPDGRTMYFMSTGHTGLGGYDLFVSKKGDDGKWSKPINMGPSINSPEDEGGVFVDRKGKYAYFSKTEKTETSLKSDIYRFELPSKFKPDPVSYIELKVIDAKTKQALKASLLIKNTQSKTKKTLSISTEGITEIIQVNTPYELTVEKEGYLFYSDHIDPTINNTVDNPFVYTIELQAIPVAEKEEESEEIVLRNIYFETGKSELLSASFDELNRLVGLLEKQANLQIIIFGHTDNVGNDQDNLLLSENRVKAVQEYLIKKQISSDRIQIKALGESQPIADNSTEEGRAQNRRISFRLQ